jgi:hypothetical protein
MGHFIISANEAGINQIFKAIFNALPPVQVSRGFGLSAAGGQVSITASVQAQPIDYNASDRPVDLLGVGNPQIRIKPIGLRLVNNVSAGFQLHNWVRTATAQLTVDVTGSAHARIDCQQSGQQPGQQSGQQWRTRLSVAAAEVAVSLEPNRDRLRDAVREALQHIDTSPAPGRQPLPQGVVNNIVDQVFNQLTTPIEAALTAALRSQLGAMRIDVAASLPRQWPLPVPGAADLMLTIDQLQPQVSAQQLQLVADFSVS